jgi:Flp pilus assembly protein TadG
MTAMRRRLVGRRTGDAESGAAAVEMALLLPVLLLILFGIIDFGRALNTQIALTQASREGVRRLALGSTANPTSVVQASASSVSGISVAYTTCPASPGPTSVATVTASKTFSYITPISGVLNLLGFSSLAAPVITGRAEMRCGG